MTPTTTMCDKQELVIDAAGKLAKALEDASPSNPAQALIDSAAEDLEAAQEALDAARAAMAEEPPDTTTARTKLQESIDLTASAMAKLKQALGL